MNAIAYLRVSTEEQHVSGAGLAAQRSALVAECARRRWHPRIIEDAGYSARDLRRPGIQEALELLDSGQYQALIVVKLDRLSRSTLDFAGIMDRATRRGWAVVTLDCAVDMTTPAGEAMANMLATFAQFERKLIGQRTRDALAVKRAQGVRLGRPPIIPAGIRAEVRAQRGAGRTYGQIAAALNAADVPTAQGGRQWWPSTVRAVCGP